MKREIKVKKLYLDKFLEAYKAEYNDMEYDDEKGQYKFESIGLIMNAWNNKIILNNDIFCWCGYNERVMLNQIDFIKNNGHYLETTLIEEEQEEEDE